MSATTATPYLTLGQAAQRLGAQVWQVARVFERGLLPEPPRVGRCRVVTEEQLPELRRVLVEAGFLPAGPTME